MNIQDRDLQAAYRGWLAGNNPPGHLDDASWERLATDDLEASERALLFHHILSCATCSEVWRSVLALESEASAEGLLHDRPAASRFPWRSRMMPLALAATVLLAIGGVLMMRQSTPPVDTVRGIVALPPVEGLMMAYSSDGVPNLVWTPVPGATTYRVEVFTEDGRPFWSGDMTGPPIQWPAGLPRLKGAYRWRVEAEGAAGAIARSRLTPLEMSR
jgi:hypothetical protein